MTYQIILLVELTKLSEISDKRVVIMRYSSVSFGKRSTNGRMTEP